MLPLILIKANMIKIYQAILDKQLNTTVMVNGQEVRLNFSGGEREYNGVCIVSEKDTQDAIEGSPSYNKLFKLRETIEPQTATLKGPGTAVHGTVDSEVLKKNKLIKEPVGPEVEKFVFHNINEAQEMLTAEPYLVAVSKIRTLAGIEIIAKELGIKIEFNRQ